MSLPSVSIGPGPEPARPASPERTSRLRLIDRGIQGLLRRRFGHAALRFALRHGPVLLAPPGAVATVLLKDRLTLLRFLLDPQRAFGDDYANGAIDVRGDLVAALESAYRALDRGARPAHAGWPRQQHSLRSSQENVHRHYDLGNDFYALWLDEQMLYTCAYFPTPEATLEEAQVAKMDLVCRKLDLRPGERVVEAGCGWGALALHMARRCGVSVKAYNVSREQVRYARQRAWNEGLASQVEFVLDDYRNVVGHFDAFVSVGMLEHVGLENYPALGRIIDRSLRERGRGLLHFIGRDQPSPLNAWIGKRIFPGAYPPALHEALAGVLEPANVSVIHVENMRPHYAATLAHWRARFEASAQTVMRRYGEEFTRAWRLYLAGSEAAFRTGSLQLFQVVFARAEARTGVEGETRHGHAEL